MKKFNLVICFVFAFSLFVAAFEEYKYIERINVTTSDSIEIVLEHSMKTDEEKIKLFHDMNTLANKYKISIFKFYYEINENTFKDTDYHIYIFTNDFSTYENLFIKKELPMIKNDEYFINIKDNLNKSGYIKSFNKSDVFQIQTFEAMSPDYFNMPIGGSYYIKSKDIENIENFLSEIKSVNNSFNECLSENTDIYIIQTYNKGIIFTFPIFTIILLLIGSGVSILFNYSEVFALEKMYGYSTFDSIWIFIKTNIINKLLITSISAILGSVLFLFFYNNLEFYIPFLFYYFKNFLTYSILYVLVCAIIGYLIILIMPLTSTIKKNKPYKIITFTDLVLKIVASILIIFTIKSLSIYIPYIHAFNTKESKEQLHFLSEYVETKIYTPGGMGLVSDELLKEEFNAFRAYFQKENEYGAILFYKIENYFENYGLCINNNYLKLNPIYDIEKKQIFCNDENSSDLTILIPQNKKENTEIYIKNLVSNFSFIDASTEEEKLEKIKIVYIEDNQDFLNLDITINSTNQLYEENPIILIINNNNCHSGIYQSALSQSALKIKNDHDYELIFKNNNFNVFKFGFLNSYDHWQYNVKKIGIIAMESVITILSLIIFSSICIYYLTQSHLQLNNKMLGIKKMLGYSYLNMDNNIFTLSLSSNIIIYIISFFIIGFVKSFIYFIVISLFDTLVAFILLRIYLKKGGLIKNEV